MKVLVKRFSKEILKKQGENGIGLPLDKKPADIIAKNRLKNIEQYICHYS